MKKLEITLYKSLIGRTPNQVKNTHHLGLRKINQKVIKEDIPTVRGVLNKIHHLVVVKEVLEGRV